MLNFWSASLRIGECSAAVWASASWRADWKGAVRVRGVIRSKMYCMFGCELIEKTMLR